MNQERDVIQIIKRGTPDMIPRIPSILEMMQWQSFKSVAEPKKEIKRVGYRYKGVGDGICASCRKKILQKDFATPMGYICKTCKKPNSRGATKNKRIKSK